ncbi:MAG: hypothetical protein C0624_02785 [Desulfuromonas sp.]|nr:MAG: hypothetical protein C0624_02785 [Desulfuromonas sp.]
MNRCCIFRSTRGFTLIELVVVLVIMSTILAISGPRLARFARSAKLEAAANRLQVLLLFAKEQALWQKSGTRVVVLDGWRGVEVWERDTTAEEERYVSIPQTGAKNRFPDGISLVQIRLNGATIPDGQGVELEVNPLISKDMVEFFLKGAEGELYRVWISAGGGLVGCESV